MKSPIAIFIFTVLPSILAEVLAFVFFFLADWRVGVGYSLVWLSEFNFKQAFSGTETGRRIADEYIKKREEEKKK